MSCARRSRRFAVTSRQSVRGIVTEPDQVRASLDIVAAETDRLERLVGDVLDLAKLQAHRFTVRHEEVDLSRVLDHAYGAFAEEARRREIDYRLAGEAEAPVILSDGDRVLQVITNLLSNAFRWTPDGGRVELSLGADNGVARVDVIDTGPGIPLEKRERGSSTRSSPRTSTAPGSGSHCARARRRPRRTDSLGPPRPSGPPSPKLPLRRGPDRAALVALRPPVVEEPAAVRRRPVRGRARRRRALESRL